MAWIWTTLKIPKMKLFLAQTPDFQIKERIAADRKDLDGWSFFDRGR